MRRSFQGGSPKVHPTAFVHDAAELIGRVKVGAHASIWPSAVIRADVDRIEIGARTNIQDGAVVHCREGSPTRIGAGCTVGHRAIVHGARIGERCLIGMGAIVMEADIGRECLIAAGAMVPAGMRVPARSLVMGLPAKVARKLTPKEIRGLRESEEGYVALSRKHRETSRVQF